MLNEFGTIDECRERRLCRSLLPVNGRDAVHYGVYCCANLTILSAESLVLTRREGAEISGYSELSQRSQGNCIDA